MKGRRITYWLFIRTPFWMLVTSVALVTLLRWVPVRYTPLMLKRSFQFRNEENYHSEQKWVSLEDIAPELIQAVIAAEDQKFWDHHGFDWDELRGMWRSHRLEGTPLRGCSTISQQTAKNVFTFATPTWGRKAVEACWTILIETIWGKNRILEVYLNVAETGKGLYGVEAATVKYYNQRAAGISAKQAVALAVCLPHPLFSNPIEPSAYDRARRTRMIDSFDNQKMND